MHTIGGCEGGCNTVPCSCVALAPGEPDPVYGCPHCGAHDENDIQQWGDVGATWGGEFDSAGEWQDDNNGADMCWDAVGIDHYYCRSCDKPFDAPALLDDQGKPTSTLGPSLAPAPNPERVAAWALVFAAAQSWADDLPLQELADERTMIEKEIARGKILAALALVNPPPKVGG